MSSVFWFSKLKAGAEAQAYERWVQQTDYRLAQEITCILHYRVHRIAGLVDGQGRPPFDYIEVLEVTDIDEYRSAMNGHPAIRQIVAEIGEFIVGAGSAWGEPIAPLGKERCMD
jgi:REDY-like protein HapK